MSFKTALLSSALASLLQAQHQARNGQLTEEQKQQFKQRKQSLREKVKAAMRANAPQGV